MKISDEKLEQILHSQVWIEPSAGFTDRVLSQLPAFAPAPQRTRWYERALLPIPAVAILVLLIQHARLIGGAAANYVQEIGLWVGSTTGQPLFAAYPILVLGIVAPILVGAVASCALTGRCRITRAMTS